MGVLIVVYDPSVPVPTLYSLYVTTYCTALQKFSQITMCCYTIIIIGASYFWVFLSGQTIASLCNVLIWGAASHLSEVWFPASERATSTAISATVSPNVNKAVKLMGWEVDGGRDEGAFIDLF